MDRPVHPLFPWLQQEFPHGDENVDYAKAAARCRKLGRKVGATYLQQIALGHYSPHYKLGRFLSEKLTGGEVSTDAIMNYPYTRAPERAA